MTTSYALSERALPTVVFTVRGNEIGASGPDEDVAIAKQLFGELLMVLRSGHAVTPDSVERAVSLLRTNNAVTPSQLLTAGILSNRGRSIRPKTLGQKEYVDAIDKHTVVFGIGPAGTGKTYLAVAKAVPGAAEQDGQSHHPYPSCRRSWRAIGILAWHVEREDRSVPAPAVRRVARHDRPGLNPAAHDEWHYRSRAVGLYARAHSTMLSSSLMRHKTRRRSR